MQKQGENVLTKGKKMIDKRGLKRTCPKCGTIFYDMGKTSFVCPKCDKKFDSQSYQTETVKTLSKKIKHDAIHLEEDDIDTETLLKMTNTLPDETDKESDDLMEIEEPDTEDMGELGDFMDDYNNDKDN